MDNEPLCTCGKRPKHKCCEESEHGSGKMCLREDNLIPEWDTTIVYPEGSIVRWYDGTIVKSKYTVCGGRPKDWYDPTKTDKYDRAVEAKP